MPSPKAFEAVASKLTKELVDAMQDAPKPKVREASVRMLTDTPGDDRVLYQNLAPNDYTSYGPSHFIKDAEGNVYRLDASHNVDDVLPFIAKDPSTLAVYTVKGTSELPKNFFSGFKSDGDKKFKHGGYVCKKIST